MLPLILMASAMIQTLSPGEPMPVLKGEFLTGRAAVLPEAASGRVALLALAWKPGLAGSAKTSVTIRKSRSTKSP